MPSLYEMLDNAHDGEGMAALGLFPSFERRWRCSRQSLFLAVRGTHSSK
jgi:hypothetical protein